MAGYWISILFYRKAFSAKVRGYSHGIWELIQGLSANQNMTNFHEIEYINLSLTEVIEESIKPR